MTRRGLFSLLLAPFVGWLSVRRRELMEADLRRAVDAIWARQASMDAEFVDVEWYDPVQLETVSLPVSNGVIENLTDEMCGD